MAAGATSPSIVGRDVELALIGDALAAAAEGHPRIVLLGGEAGIGKSRLVREAGERARAAGSAVLTGACLDIGEGGLPYLPVAEALRGLARSVSADELERVLGPGRDDFATLVPEFARPIAAPTLVAAGTGPAASHERTSEVAETAPAPRRDTPSGIDRARLFERFIGFIGRLGEPAPAFVVIEDVHWIDAATRDLLTFLVRNLTTERVAAIVSYRYDDLPQGHPVLAWLAEVGRAPGAVRIDLARLDRAGVARQLSSLAGEKLPPDRVERIWRRSEGNPLFVEELFAADVAGDVRSRPPSLVEILLTRVSSLAPTGQAVLAAVALAARPVDDRLLAAVAELDEVVVQGALREAIARGVLVVDAADGRYRFRHELLREVVERGLLPGERRRLHERFARLLAEHPDLADPSPADAAGELAHHWAAAERPVEAHTAAIVAAAAAEGVQAFEEAHRHLERALALESRLPADHRPTDAERREIRRRAAEVADLAGEFERATSLLHEALDLVDAAAEPTTAGLIRSRLGYLRWVTGDSESALGEHREAVRLVPETPASGERARVLAGLGGALMGAGHWTESRTVCVAAIDCAVAADAASEESRARNMLGSALVALGDIEAGLTELRTARQIASRTGPPELLIAGHHNLAVNLLAADVLDEALDEAQAGRRAAREAGLERRFGMDLAALAGDALLRLGRWDEADAVTREGLALDQLAIGTTYLAAVRARLDGLRGDAAEAEHRLATIERSQLDPDVAGFVAAVRGEVALAAGDPAAAHAAATEGLERLEGLDDVLWSAPLVAIAARSLAETAEAGRAHRDDEGVAAAVAAADVLLALAETMAARAATPSSKARILLARVETGRVRGAADPTAWDRVAGAFAAVPDPLYEAYARFRLAEAGLRARGIRAEEPAVELRLADGIARRLRARPLGRDIEALAARARIDLREWKEGAFPSTAAEGEPSAAGAAGGRGIPASAVGRPHGLSSRELEVLALVAAGLTNGEIAERLFITRKTAAVHVTHILDKLGVSNRVEAAMIAARLGIIATSEDDALVGAG